jgi:hypothetical protein
MNFNNIGANTLQESNAFKKVRMFSKVYTTNLVHTPSHFTNKYITINSLYSNENDFNTAFNYGLKRQHNLTSSSATTNTFSTFLDKLSMNKFLSHNLNVSIINHNTTDLTSNFNLLSKNVNDSFNINNINTISLLFQNNNQFNSNHLQTLLLYPNLTQEMNDDSDKKMFNYPLRKLLNNKLTNNNLIDKTNLLSTLSITYPNSLTSNFANNLFGNNSTTNKTFNPTSPNQSFLPSERSIRTFTKLAPNKAHYNLSSGFNSLDSNMTYSSNIDATTDLNNFFYLNKSN